MYLCNSTVAFTETSPATTKNFSIEPYIKKKKSFQIVLW